MDDLSATQQTLWNQVVALWEMAVAQDLPAIAAALHEDYSGWVTGQPRPHDYRAALASVGPDAPRILRYALSPLQVTVFDDRVGVAHYSYDAEVEADGGGRHAMRGRWTEVYLRDGAAWRMIAVSGGPDGQR